MNNYEVHITVDAKLKLMVTRFQETCAAIGVKSIVIETENAGEFHNQVMTSHSFKADNYVETMESVAKSLTEAGFTIIRKKVEMEPGDIKHPDHIYYESHLRLKLPLDYKLSDETREFFKLSGFHLSKNVFKRSDTHYYQMITYRTNLMDVYSFRIVINIMKNTLADLGIECDKIEIEECIFDTNQNIDSTWLNGNS